MRAIDRTSEFADTMRAAVATCAVLMVLCSIGCSEKHPIRIATPPTIDAVSAWVTAVNDALAKSITGAPNTPIEKRNKALSYSEAMVMARYGEVRKNLVKGRAITEVSFDILNLGLAGAVPIVNGTRGKTILGALATGFLGVQNSVDKNVFQQQTMGALLSAMDTCVAREQAVIDGHRLLDLSLYDEYGAYVDLVKLYGCTTVPGAIQELTETQAAKSEATKQAVLAPVSAAELSSFQDLQKAFLASAEGDKEKAVAFLSLLNVTSVSKSSTKDDLIAAYRGLLMSAVAAPSRKTLLDAAHKSGLLP